MPTEIRMPELSADMEEADLVSWLVAPGDRVAVGDLLAEIETDKATVELEAEIAGVVAELRVAAGTTGVKVGEVLALIDPEDADERASAPEPRSDESAARGPRETDAPPAPETRSDEPPARASGAADGTSGAAADGTSGAAAERPAATALARRIAARTGVELAGLDGSGPGGKIVKRDVESAAADGEPSRRRAAEPATDRAAAAQAAALADAATFDAPSVEMPHTRLRRSTAARVAEAKRTVPHLYLRSECELDRLLAVRRELNETGDVEISVDDFVVRAIALALRAVPEAHVAWGDESLVRFERADIAVSVATDDGTVTPVVRGADRKGLAAIAAEMRDLVERARKGRLRPEESRGGTFGVSNLGMHGVESVTPILSPPQSGILGVGAAVERPVARDGEVAVATVMVCTLAVDHRALDGATAARLLAAFRERIEEPLEMVL